MCRHFCLKVAKCARNRQNKGKNPYLLQKGEKLTPTCLLERGKQVNQTASNLSWKNTVEQERYFKNLTRTYKDISSQMEVSRSVILKSLFWYQKNTIQYRTASFPSQTLHIGKRKPNYTKLVKTFSILSIKTFCKI